MEIRTNSLPKEDTHVVDDIIGTYVIDNKGKEVGRVKQVHIDPVNLTVEGITIDNGLFHENDYVDRGYIFLLSVDKVVLSDIPISNYKGMKVIDSAGNDVGTVSEVTQAGDSNNVYALTVNRGALKDDMVVTGDQIEKVEDKIFLNEAIRD
jgi:sporulation protein YlmC with PRC-barrel domain